MRTPGVTMKNGGSAGSGGRDGLVVDGAVETWTTLNPNIDVVAGMTGVIDKWLAVDRFLNSPTPSLQAFGRSGEVDGSSADVGGGVGAGSLDLPKTKACAAEKGEAAILLPPANERIRDFSRLNRADLKELNRHRALLSQRQWRHLRSVEEKPDYYPDRFRDPAYLPQSAILLLSQGWASAERYALCGIGNGANGAGVCKLHKFCPYCCWYERSRRQLTYVPAFENGTWHWLTGSFTGDLAMNTPADAHDWPHYWDAYKAAFVKWVAKKFVRGVFWTEELAVNSLLPTRVLPHVHAIVDADFIDDEDLQALRDTLNAHLRSSLGPEHLEPNIKAEQVETARSLFSFVGYMIKPFNILTAYERAWPRAYPHNRHLAQQLNNQATDLVLGYSHVTTDRYKINVKGSLDSKAKSFIGIPKDERDDYRGVLAEIKAQANDNYIETGDQEEEPGQLSFAGPESVPGLLPVPAPPLAHQNGSQVPLPYERRGLEKLGYKSAPISQKDQYEFQTLHQHVRFRSPRHHIRPPPLRIDQRHARVDREAGFVPSVFQARVGETMP